MRINVANADKIAEVLDAAQSGCRSRTATAEDVKHWAARAEARLHGAGVPKAMRKGSVASVEPEKVPNSYRYPAEGTYLHLERGASAWFLIGANRGRAGSCAGGSAARMHVSVPRHADLLAKMAEAHGITVQAEETDNV